MLIHRSFVAYDSDLPSFLVSVSMIDPNFSLYFMMGEKLDDGLFAGNRAH